MNVERFSQNRNLLRSSSAALFSQQRTSLFATFLWLGGGDFFNHAKQSSKNFALNSLDIFALRKVSLFWRGSAGRNSFPTFFNKCHFKMKRQHTMGAGRSSANPKQRRAKSQKFRKSSSTPLRRGTDSDTPGVSFWARASKLLYIRNWIFQNQQFLISH